MIETAFCLIFGGAIVTGSVLGLRDDVRSKSYPAVEADFSDATVVSDEGSYLVKLTYEYEFGGRKYTFDVNAKSFTGNEAIMLRSSAEEKADSFRMTREPIRLYVNPDKPRKARTEVGINPINIAMVIFGLVFIAVGLRLYLYD